MKKRPLATGIIAAFFIFLLVLNVSALTGRLGNSRAVLRLDVGEEVERYLLVENANDIPLTIELIPLGDLADNIDLEKETFVLQPGESEKAYFTIKADEPGTTETKINVKFIPEEGNGVGLSATIIVIAGGENSNEGSGEDNVITENNETNFSFAPRAVQINQDSANLSPLTILLILSTILVVVLIILISFYLIKSKKKRARRPGA